MKTKKLIIILTLLIFTIGCQIANAQGTEPSLGNSIIQEEYPTSDKILPTVNEIKDDGTFTIEGAVEKNIDITLQECLRIALGNNPKIRSAVEDISAADARIAQTWSNYFPQLSWTTNASKNRNLLFNDAIAAGSQSSTYNYYILGQISVSQMLYDFGVTQNQVTIKKLAFKSSKETLASVVNTVIKETKDNYYNLLYAYDKKKVAEDNVAKFELFYNQAKAFYEIGMKPKVDVTIAEVNLSNAKLQLIQSNTAIDVAIAQLNNVMGLPYVTKFNVSERLAYNPLELTLDQAVDMAKEARPELKIAAIAVESAKQQVKLNKKSYLPQLTFEANYARGGRSWNSSYGYAIGGYLNFPTVNALLINKQIAEAKALYDKQLAEAQVTKDSICLEIQNAYYNLVDKKNQLPVAFLGMKQSKENYELSFGRYHVGEAAPTELKDAQIQYLNSQLSYYEALYRYNSAKANLEQAIGKNLNSDEEITLEK